VALTVVVRLVLVRATVVVLAAVQTGTAMILMTAARHTVPPFLSMGPRLRHYARLRFAAACRRCPVRQAPPLPMSSR